MNKEKNCRFYCNDSCIEAGVRNKCSDRPKCFYKQLLACQDNKELLETQIANLGDSIPVRFSKIFKDNPCKAVEMYINELEQRQDKAKKLLSDKLCELKLELSSNHKVRRAQQGQIDGLEFSLKILNYGGNEGNE